MMNLPLTPIEEAWNTPKPKKTYPTNQYNNNKMQIKMLKQANQNIQETFPSGNDNVPRHSEAIIEEQIVEDVHNHNEKTKEMTIKITNQGLLNYLSKYNTNYINEFVQNALHQFLKTKQTTETFVNKSMSSISEKDNLQTILLIFVVLYAIDLCMRFKRWS